MTFPARQVQPRRKSWGGSHKKGPPSGGIDVTCSACFGSFSRPAPSGAGTSCNRIGPHSHESARTGTITFRPAAPNCRFHGRHAAAAISRWRASGRPDQSEPNLSRFAGIPVRTVWTHNGLTFRAKELQITRVTRRRSHTETADFGQAASKRTEFDEIHIPYPAYFGPFPRGFVRGCSGPISLALVCCPERGAGRNSPPIL